MIIFCLRKLYLNFKLIFSLRSTKYYLYKIVEGPYAHVRNSGKFTGFINQNVMTITVGKITRFQVSYV